MLPPVQRSWHRYRITTRAPPIRMARWSSEWPALSARLTASKLGRRRGSSSARGKLQTRRTPVSKFLNPNRCTPFHEPEEVIVDGWPEPHLVARDGDTIGAAIIAYAAKW